MISIDTFSYISPTKAQITIGPVFMDIFAAKLEHPLEQFSTLYHLVEEHLTKVATNRNILSKNWKTIPLEELNDISWPIYDNVMATGDPQLTLMVGIAGYMAEVALHLLKKMGTGKAYVNNGGDIALFLPIQESFNLGIISSVFSGKISEIVRICGQEQIGGIATSGVGGRSFSLGIAEAVTVFAKSPSMADICATVIANKSYIESRNVSTKKAKEIDPNSDIAELHVVTKVDTLTKAERDQAKRQLLAEAEKQYDLGNISKVIAYIQGERICLNV